MADPTAPRIYLSLSGSDSNDGLASDRPLRTYAKAVEKLMPMRGQGATLYVRGWEGPLHFDSRGPVPAGLDWLHSDHPERPAVLDFTECGQIDTGNTGAIDGNCQEDRPGANAIIRGLRCRPGSRQPGSGINGIKLVGAWQNLKVLTCDLVGYYVNLSLEGQQYDGKNRRAKNILIRGNVIGDAHQVGTDGHAMGMLIGHADGVLVERNVMDHNGWSETVPGAIGTQFRHGCYVNPDNTSAVTTRQNMLVDNWNGGLRSGGAICEENLCIGHACGIAVGRDAKLVRRNIVMECHDSQADMPAGTGIDFGECMDAEAYQNIVAHAGSGSTGNTYGYRIHPGSYGLQLHDNTGWNWNAPGTDTGQMVFYNGHAERLSIYNNSFGQPSGGRGLWSAPTDYIPALGGNRWWSTNQKPFMLQTTPPAEVWMDFAAYQAAALAHADSFGAGLVKPVSKLEQIMAMLGKTGGKRALAAAARRREAWVWQVVPAFLAEAGYAP